MKHALDKLKIVVQHSFSSVLPPVFNVVISMLVIRWRSPELWGAVVDVVVVAQLAAHIIAFGNKEHLLRLFSTDDGDGPAAWASSLRTRTSLLGPAAVVAAVAYGRWGQGWALATVAPCIVWIVGQALLQSLDVAVLFHKRFGRQIAVEVAGTATVLVVLLSSLERLDAPLILWLLATVTTAKAIVLRLWFLDVLPIQSPQLRPGLLRESMAFFLLGVSGLLGSRVDLYCVAALLPDGEVARYQVLMNMLLYLQALSNLILLPFVREVYGMQLPKIRALSVRFLGLGAVLCAGGVAGVWVVMTHGYQLPISRTLLALGYGYALQMYLALPLVYGLYKAGRERLVLHANVVSVVLNFAGNMVMIPVMGIEGALLSSFVVQATVALVYLVAVSKLAEEPVFAGRS
jgi:O-antigen/teichoic acid export membrane protein